MNTTVSKAPVGAPRSFSLVEWSLSQPKKVLGLIGFVACVFMAAFPFATTDTNPKNMLPPTAEVRVSNDAVEKRFGLHEDTVVVAVTPRFGVLRPETLEKLRKLNADILGIEGVVRRDVVSLFTTDNITSQDDSLKIRPLVPTNVGEPGAVEQLRKELFDGSLFVDRLISQDERTTAFYIPLEENADGSRVAIRVQELASKYFSAEELAVTGDPVARDRFGADMFRLMAMFAPVAGMLMMLLVFWMFKSWWLAGVVMMTAMVSIAVALGGAIALGYPVHIMSSMAPVFLMAISTDAIHIFNEFFQRYRGDDDRAPYIRETMAAVARPVRYTLLATAAGFAVLLFMSIVPVKVFGAIIVVGTIVLRVLSFSLIPACLMLVPLPKTPLLARHASGPSVIDRLLNAVGSISVRHSKPIIGTAVILAIVSAVGLSKVIVNNNMLHWFKPGSDLRVADNLMSAQLGGSAPAFLVIKTNKPDGMKEPSVLMAMDKLQHELKEQGLVGASLSVADYVKRINKVLNGNTADKEVIPEDRAAVGQYLLAFSMAAKPSDINRVVDYPYEQGNILLQLKSWDASTMEKVVAYASAFVSAENAPFTVQPAGAAYFNLVWNEEVLKDMIVGFAIALVVVFGILAIDFRSIKWAVVAYIPLILTVLIVFGFTGWVGKDFDMPVAVLSCLSLGMAVDFAIHFVSRYRQQRAAIGPLEDRDKTLQWVIAWPGKGIVRNALLFAVAFSVMIFAPLTPYVTVGVFIVSMMCLSALATLSLLPALIAAFKLGD